MHTDTPQRVLDMIDVRNADKSGDLNGSWSHERTAKTPMEELAARLTQRGEGSFIWAVFDSTQTGVLEASVKKSKGHVTCQTILEHSYLHST